jgi:hypothetical protein
MSSEGEITALIEQNKLGQATAELEILAEMEVSDAWVYEKLGDIYTLMNAGEAVISYQKSIRIEPSESVYKKLFTLLEEQKNSLKYRNVVREAEKKFPGITQSNEKIDTDETPSSENLKKHTALKSAEAYLKSRTIVDFISARETLEASLADNRFDVEIYEALVDLLLKKPMGWKSKQYISRFTEADEAPVLKRNYRKNLTYRQYNSDAYRYIENPLYDIDALVSRMNRGRGPSLSKYDTKWLADQYLRLAQSMLAQNPNNPSDMRDNAFTLLERGYELDRTNTAIKTLRNTYRTRR